MLQVLVLLLLLVQLILSSAANYEVIAAAPIFSLEWRFDDYARNVWTLPRVFNAWDGKVHFNLNWVAFETNLTSNPRICLTKPEICLDSELVDGSRRFVWPLEDFAKAVQDEIDVYASKLYTKTNKVNKALGLEATDDPWYFDLSVTSEGHACSGREEYAYSYGSPSGVFDCHRVYDVRMPPASFSPIYLRAYLRLLYLPAYHFCLGLRSHIQLHLQPTTHPQCARQPDGSVHGKPNSYGRYNGMNVSISMELVDDGRKSWRRLCDIPEACT